MKLYKYRSECEQYIVIFSDSILDFILATCEQSAPNETGGILVGYYTKTLDCAVITQASKAPYDSKSGKTWFYRGKHGIQEWLAKLWFRETRYYLGEWHFHPFASAIPSYTDKCQMKSIATTRATKCPEPILLIIGGNPLSSWELRIFIFPKGVQMIELKYLDTQITL